MVLDELSEAVLLLDGERVPEGELVVDLEDVPVLDPVAETEAETEAEIVADGEYDKDADGVFDRVSDTEDVRDPVWEGDTVIEGLFVALAVEGH